MGRPCYCVLIEAVRADEKEKAAQRIDNKYTAQMLKFGRLDDKVLDAYTECAQIVRGDGEQG
ncbi:hypothetical protein EBZ39_06870 [bacterium]|nr:hypothetical protein [bacterium]